VDLVLTAARSADGALVDVTITDGHIVEVVPAGSRVPPPTAEVLDGGGRLLLPAFTEPHAHLDKTRTAGVVPNPAGDLAGAIVGWIAHRPTLTADDVFERARATLRTAALAGVSVLRTHIDTTPGLDLAALEGLHRLRTAVADVVDLQLVVGAGLPLTGLAGRESLARLRDALAVGADAIGGAPSLDAEPNAALDLLVDAAAEHGHALDLHVDETLDPDVFVLGRLADAALDLDVPVTADHCVSLSVQPEKVRWSVAERLAVAGVAVVALPQTNLFLQARGPEPDRSRGITAVHELRAAGVVVAGGSDNVADPFNPLGRADPLETASLLVAAAHLDLPAALDAVTGAARRAVGLQPAPIAPGSPADLVLIDATDLGDAVGRAPADRTVLRRGRVVARSVTTTTWAGDPSGGHP
jgi:cytosine deaminase